MISARLLLGVLFLAAGVARLYLERKRAAGHERGGRALRLGRRRAGAAGDRARRRCGGAEPPAGESAGRARPRRGRANRAQISARSLSTLRRSIGSPLLFAIVYTSLASAIYFSLGVIAGHALGLTPLVFLIAALLFALTAMTYAEGASLHQERSGSTVFARYAFNELVSFVAGWAILLDYIILIAVTAYSATQYLRCSGARWATAPRRSGWRSCSSRSSCWATSAASAGGRARRVALLVVGDLVLQGFIVVLGLVLFFNPHTLLDPIHLGSAPTWSGLVFALTIAVISFTSLESAAGLAGEVRISRGGAEADGRRAARRRWCSCTWASRSWRSPRCRCTTATPQLATRYLNDPMIGIVAQMHPHWLARTLRYLVGRARRADAGGRRQLGDARPLAAGLLAVHQPPDPEWPRPPAPAALDALRADHPRRA